ncbi:winged helix-turn-helix transcriptional regulator [Rhodococcus rhodochrous]|uniref:winged helix-turn-helix transcriptional regulator n=1 Tax=Rhodococcus rhodochrous TaxID=1829 RepID=UPI0024BAE34E|nr:helix-turn-helix domain-containing protein [Rhodococcus rhodochrous]MDJ0400126.1 helix-turn-helix domain-containing protein [Rhodococcus rhodochrous]
MSASGSAGYCSFTKAIEHLGDRWSLLVVRQLGTLGPQGFNDLATGLPGRISRSVLADRLRRLEMLGVVSRCEGPHPAYRLTDVGLGLMTPLGALRTWAETWLPDDPAMVERDPDVMLGWLAQRVDRAHCPVRPVVLEFRLHQTCDRRYWLVVQRGAQPYGCLTDPLLDPARYVYLESSIPALLALAHGRCDWSCALRDGSVTAAGDPALMSRVGEWFRPVPEGGAHAVTGCDFGVPDVAQHGREHRNRERLRTSDATSTVEMG